MGRMSDLLIESEEELAKEYLDEHPNTPSWAVQAAVRGKVLDRATQKLSVVLEHHLDRLLE